VVDENDLTPDQLDMIDKEDKEHRRKLINRKNIYYRKPFIKKVPIIKMRRMAKKENLRRKIIKYLKEKKMKKNQKKH